MKYFEQKTHYTCAAACFRMMLSQFFPDESFIPSEEQLERMLKIDQYSGTDPKEIIELGFEVFNLYSFYEPIGSLEQIADLASKGFVIMLLVSIDSPHCIIYLKHDHEKIYYHDPMFGENKSFSLELFCSHKQSFPFLRWRIKSEEFKKYWPDIDFSRIESSEGFMAFKKSERMEHLMKIAPYIFE